MCDLCDSCFIVSLLEKHHHYRKMDGSDNNHSHPNYGKIKNPLLKLFDHDYSNGVNQPSGQDRPSAREISNCVSTQEHPIRNSKKASNIFWLWGQFIDHDITLVHTGDEEMHIKVPKGDKYFDPEGTDEKYINFHRSAYQDGSGHNNIPREHINHLTPFIDSSNVYGSTPERNKYLRAYCKGKMNMSAGGLMPMNDGSIENAGSNLSANFVGGDIRANEHTGLTAIHTLFVREHNYWARKIRKACHYFEDEEIYQLAKVIVESEIQAITFNEFLPLLLGECNVEKYSGYNPHVNPQISHPFSIACYRLHTLIPSKTLEDSKLRDQFFSSHLMSNKYSLEYIFKNYFSIQCEEMDGKFVDDIRNMLFGPPGSGGHDLMALNVQRGRDHCLPDYNTVRKKSGLHPKDNFGEISDDNEHNHKLKKAYGGDINNVDLYVGAVAESKYNKHSMLGELFHVIIWEQFDRIRTGDKYWYENRLCKDQIEYINSVRLSDIIKRNTTLDCVPDDVFCVGRRH